jgi:hypothetical protein
MRILTLAFLLGITGVLAAFRCLPWQPSDVARAPERVEQIDPDTRPEGAAINFVPTSGDPKDNSEQRFARFASDGAPKVVVEKLPPAVLEDDPVPTPRDEPIMVGPDGVIFRKVR